MIYLIRACDATYRSSHAQVQGHVASRSQPTRHPRCPADGRQCGARSPALAAQPLCDEPGAGTSCGRRQAIRSSSGPAAVLFRRPGRSSCVNGSAGSCRTRKRFCGQPEHFDLARLVRTFTVRTSEGFVETFGPSLIARVSEEAPGVRLCFLLKPDRDSAPLREGSVDLETGVVGKTTGPEVRARGLFRDRFIGAVKTPGIRSAKARSPQPAMPPESTSSSHVEDSTADRSTKP